MISSSMKNTIDVKRQTRTFYARAKLLIRNIIHCTDKVKCYLFQSYCTSMYNCSQLWFNSTKDSLRKLRTSYNTVLCRLLCISLPYSASQMFVSRRILTFAELLRKSVYNFAKRIEHKCYYLFLFICIHLLVFPYS